LTLALAGCGSSGNAPLPTTPTKETAAVSGFWAPSTAPVTAGRPAPSNADVAVAAERYVVDNLGGDPSASSWGHYIVGYTYSSGVLRVALQVDRSSPEGKQTGEQAARAIANFIRFGSPPPELAEVNWVEATDGAGTQIAQDRV